MLTHPKQLIPPLGPFALLVIFVSFIGFIRLSLLFIASINALEIITYFSLELRVPERYSVWLKVRQTDGRTDKDRWLINDMII